MKKSFIIIFIILSITPKIFSQSVGEFVSSYTGDNGKEYFQPLTNMLGSTINSGLFNHTIHDKSNNGWNFQFGIVTMTGLILNKDRSFTATSAGSFISEQSIEAPTIFGDSETVSVDGVSGTTYSFPNGLDMRILPFGMPQISFSFAQDFDIVLRLFFADLSEELGWLNVWGGGIRWDMKKKFDTNKFEFLSGLYYQSYNVGDVINIDAYLLNGQWFYPKDNYQIYGALGFEHATMDVAYFFESDYGDENISVDTDSYSFVKLTLGTSYDFKKLRLFTDINIGTQFIWVTGAMFNF